MADVSPPQALLASSNPHKLDEIQAVIPADALQIVTLDWLTREYQDAFVEPVEDADTFEGNALKKAVSYAEQSGWVTIADDSGLAVDALNGAPGVISARYAGVSGPRSKVDPANNRKLIEALADVPLDQRTAHFVCVMAMVWPAVHPEQGMGDDGLPKRPPVVVRGEVHGRILLPDEAADRNAPHAGRGRDGFGYDPLFVLPDDHAEHPGKTLAELTDAQKNALSHRGVATRKLLAELPRHGWIDG